MTSGTFPSVKSGEIDWLKETPAYGEKAKYRV